MSFIGVREPVRYSNNKEPRGKGGILECIFRLSKESLLVYENLHRSVLLRCS